MPKQKTPEDYHKLAQERAFKWLGPEVPNTKTKTWWECTCGNRFETRFEVVRLGCNCPICGTKKVAAQRRKTPEDYHKLAQECAFKWLGPEVSNNHTKTWWECKQGHKWETAYHNIQSGRGCPFCANRVAKTPDDYHALARERGIYWLGPEVANVLTKTSWRCKKGHTWKTKYAEIQQGRGCPECAIEANAKRNRISPTAYQTLARERGFEWLGPEVPNNRTKTTWMCKEGHKWKARYSDIQKEAGCPTCHIQRQIERQRKKPNDYHQLANEQGLRWLGPEVFNNRTKTWWECKEGHKWKARYDDIRGGHGCPECTDMVNGARVSKPQRILCEMLSGELNHRVGDFWIDVSLNVDGVSIAIEYDAWYWHADREQQDNQRDKILLQAGWRILRIKSNTQIPTPDQLDSAINQLLSVGSYIEIILDDWGSGPTR